MVFYSAGASIIEHAKERKSGSHFSRSPQELGEGADRGDPGGLDRRRVDPAGRRQAMGLSGISKSQVSKLCKENGRVTSFNCSMAEQNWS